MLTLPRGHRSMLSDAVKSFWQTRAEQAQKQAGAGRSDQGARACVTGGAQMGGFIRMLEKLAVHAGARPEWVYREQALELPGFFRPTKEWDLLVVRDGELVSVVEVKSQVGPSFGNNFNNRTEEAIGSALDLWTAYRKGAISQAASPWLGYVFLLEDCPGSQRPVRVQEPHFKVLPEFHDASYAKRYELLCRKLVRERHYSAAAFLLSSSATGSDGAFTEPAQDLSFQSFALDFIGHVAARCADRR